MQKSKKNYMCKRDYSWNPATCTCEKDEYFAITIDSPVITCDEIVNAGDSGSTDVPTNVTSNVVKSFHNKKVVIKLLFEIAVIFYHYEKNTSKLKNKNIAVIAI